jgi:hypothetical protein
MQYKSSLMVAAIVSISIEIILKNKIDERKSEKYVDQAGQKNMTILSHIESCNVVWDAIVKRLFGYGAIEYLD